MPSFKIFCSKPSINGFSSLPFLSYFCDVDQNETNCLKNANRSTPQYFFFLQYKTDPCRSSTRQDCRVRVLIVKYGIISREHFLLTSLSQILQYVFKTLVIECVRKDEDSYATIVSYRSAISAFKILCDDVITE